MNVAQLVVAVSSRATSAYCCPFCTAFVVRVRKGTRGHGRGYGFRTSAWARSDVVKHIREAHADRLEVTR